MISNELIKLAVGFVLTTLCGGLLGFIFQRRHARYQWLRARWEKELGEAQSVFEEVSRLLDRRLYRTRQLFWSFARTPEDRQERLVEYRIVITEWNDNINRILALLAIHFSDDFRNDLDGEIGAELVAVGRALEQGIRSGTGVDAKLEQRIDRLAVQIYNFNLRLLKAIRTRRHALLKSA